MRPRWSLPGTPCAGTSTKAVGLWYAGRSAAVEPMHYARTATIVLVRNHEGLSEITRQMHLVTRVASTGA